MKCLALLGASGHGKVLAEMAELIGYERVVFFDDNWPEKNMLSKWDIVGNTESLITRTSSYDQCIISIGDNKVRSEKHLLLASRGVLFGTLIHPSAVVSMSAKIGGGTVIMAGAIVNADVDLGMSCIVNTGAIVDHDSVVDDFSHISPGACLAGNVSVGMYSWIGIGAVVRQGVSIAKSVVVGAGAAVVTDVPDNLVVVGVPAKAKKIVN